MSQQISRRAFMKNNSLFLFAAGSTCLTGTLLSDETFKKTPEVTIGLLTDIHYADKAPAGSRYYQESLNKIDEAIKHFQKVKPDFVVELGDLVDAASSVDVELGYLKTIDAKFQKTCKERHYVLGNHCVDTLTKQEFLGAVKQEKSYYSFDRNGFHFIILDACFRKDGTPYQRKNFEWTDTNIPKTELDWLEKDLKKNSLPTVIFAHQRLDVTNSHGVKNSPTVRKILESSGNVLVVMQGHNHLNNLTEINGIHYCTHAAMIEGSGAENSAYSVMEIFSGNAIKINGFRKQSHQKIG